MARYMTNFREGVLPSNQMAITIKNSLKSKIEEFQEKRLYVDSIEVWWRVVNLMHMDLQRIFPRCKPLEISRFDGEKGSSHITFYTSKVVYQASKGSFFTISCIDETVYYKPVFKTYSGWNKVTTSLYEFAKLECECAYSDTRTPFYINPTKILESLECWRMGDESFKIEYSERGHQIDVRE